MKAEFSQMGEAFQEHMISEMIEKYPSYDFIIYSAVLLQTEGKYWDIIKTDPYNHEEVLEIIEDYKGEDRIDTLHDYAIDVVSPTPTCDMAQIGYAAKLEDYLYNQNWTIQRIIKGNKLDNEFLKNEMILNELLGGEGRTRQKYFKEFDSRNRAGIVSMKKDINYCLQDNKQWRIPIANIVDALLNSIDEGPFKGKIYIYNPMHILYTIYMMSAHNDIIRWAPNFYIAVEYEEHTTVYFGELKHSGAGIPFDEIVEEYFGDDLFELAFSLTWGGYLYYDLDIVKALGLTYGIYRVDITKEEREFYEYVDYDFRQCGEVHFLQNTLRYLQTASGMVDAVRNLFENLLPQKGCNVI